MLSDIIQKHISEIIKTLRIAGHFKTPEEVDTYFEKSLNETAQIVAREVLRKVREEFNDDMFSLKKSLGDIPENTCPNIDKALKEISTLQKELDYFERDAPRYDSVDDLVKDIPSSSWNWLDTPDILESLRADNDQLRGLGRDWYKQSQSILERLQSLEEEAGDYRQTFTQIVELCLWMYTIMVLRKEESLNL